MGSSVRQRDILRCGTENEKLLALAGLRVVAERCRLKAARLPYPVFMEPDIRLNRAPWREFVKITGKELFAVVLRLAGEGCPSPVRALAGDILAGLWHPCGVARLVEEFDSFREKAPENPPERIFRDLGAIGTGEAVKALMDLWGRGMDAAAAAALGMCDGTAAQDFLRLNASSHADPHVRSVCLAQLRPPVTKEKEELILKGLSTGTPGERFAAALKAKEFRMASAAPALRAALAGGIDEPLARLLGEALVALADGS